MCGSYCVCGLAVREQKIAVSMNQSRPGTPFWSDMFVKSVSDWEQAVLISQFLLLWFLILNILHSSSHLLTHDYHDMREMVINDCQIIILTTTSGSWLWQNSNIHLIWLDLVIISLPLFRMYLSQTNIGHHTLVLLDQSETSEPSWLTIQRPGLCFPTPHYLLVTPFDMPQWNPIISGSKSRWAVCVCDKFIWLQAKHLSNMSPRLQL